MSQCFQKHLSQQPVSKEFPFRNEGEAAGRTWEQTSKASLLLPLCDKKLEAEGRAMQTSKASLPYQGKCNTGTEAVGRGAHHASNGVGTRSEQTVNLLKGNIL